MRLLSFATVIGEVSAIELRIPVVVAHASLESAVSCVRFVVGPFSSKGGVRVHRVQGATNKRLARLLGLRLISVVLTGITASTSALG